MAGIASAVIGSISRAVGAAPVAERPCDLVLIPLLDDGSNDPQADMMRFQYFPESIQDTKAVNYQQKEIPGASLPLYQWVASGERLISFSATFTSDADLAADPRIAGLLDNRSGLQDRNVDVRSAVAWLRQFQFPHYRSGSSSTSGAAGGGGGGAGANGQGVSFISYPPKRLRLFIPNSGIGIAGGNPANAQGALFPHSVTCVMTQCDVTWDAFFPSGMPRIATVSLAFAQVPQDGAGVRFPTATTLADAARPGRAAIGSMPVYGYNLRANPRTSSLANGGETIRASGGR